MKNKTLIISLLFLIPLNSFSTSNNLIRVSTSFEDTPRLAYYNYDTLQYVTHEFNDSQIVYINKPLKKLIQKFEIKPYSFLPLPSKKNDMNIYGISIVFVPDSVLDNIYLRKNQIKYCNLTAYFIQPISESNFMQIANKNNFLWTRDVRNSLIGQQLIQSFEFSFD